MPSSDMKPDQCHTAAFLLENSTLRAELPMPDRKLLKNHDSSIEQLKDAWTPYDHTLPLNNSTNSAAPSPPHDFDARREDSLRSESVASTELRNSNVSGRKLFVGGLHREVDKPKLSWFFGDFTADIKFMSNTEVNKKTASFREDCWALIELSNVSEARRAIEELDGKMLHDRRVCVRIHASRQSRASKDSREKPTKFKPPKTLWVKGISQEVNEDILVEFFGDFDAVVVVMKADWAIVKLLDHYRAQQAMNMLNGRSLLGSVLSIYLNNNKKYLKKDREHVKNKPEDLFSTVGRSVDVTPHRTRHNSFDSDSEHSRSQSHYRARSPLRLSKGPAGRSRSRSPTREDSHEPLAESLGARLESDIDKFHTAQCNFSEDEISVGQPWHEENTSPPRTAEWANSVVAELMKMEMAVRPASTLDVALAVRLELQNRLMDDIVHGDPNQGTPVTIPLLQLLEHRIVETCRSSTDLESRGVLVTAN